MGDVPTDVDVEGLAAALAAHPDVVAGYLFGSVARGEALPGSDVDVAVLLDPELDERARVERLWALIGVLEPFSLREVQVVLLNTAPPLLAYQVIRDGVRLAARSEVERVAFEVHTMQRYFDIQPMLAFHKEALFQQIREVGLGRRRERDHSAVDAAERLSARLKESSER
jgi:uncharacterized protein